MMTSVSVSSFSFYKHYGTFSRRKKSSKDGFSSMASIYQAPMDSKVSGVVESTNHYISPFDSMALESFRGSRGKSNLPRPSLSSAVFGVRSEPTEDSTGVYAMFSKRTNKPANGTLRQNREKRKKDSMKEKKENVGKIPTKLRSRLADWRRGHGSEHLCRNVRRFAPICCM